MGFKELFKMEEGRVPDKKAISICVLAAFCLTMNKYLPDSISLFESSGFWKRCFANEQLSDLANWVLILVTFYFIIPLMIIKFFFKEDLSEYGL